MAPRKTQKDSAQGPGRGASRKRARRDSSLVESDAGQTQANRPAIDQSEGMDAASESTLQQPIISWAALLDSFETEPMTAQIQRHKDWRRSGSLNDKFCRVCLQPGDLYPCHTCKPAFHAGCIPDGSRRDTADNLFCAICVRRGWNVAPPSLTPPPSPGLAPARKLDATVKPAVIAPRRSMPDGSVGPAAVFNSMQEQEAAKNAMTPFPADYRAVQPRAAAIDLAGSSNSNAPSENNDRNTASPRPKRQRKSRFATLSSEVDASLAVLYRELESVASLKAQVEDLQIQNTQYLQTVKIRDNNIAVLRRDLDNRKAENEELARLRANISHHDTLKKKVEDLQSRNAQLEADLQVSREQTAAAQELVNDWKGKLSQLIGTS
ncbi:hypothetical protein N7448_002568 [Penicillium atrosanguineum]|uniref:uncharacterized protein n=1 Tax=Penicillium atrosanguineum TaxID=1132637 RepID=UPI002396FFAA|nr:uncharacterized protein N7443_005969 [Penicillium atrosanguineum]KAJ5145176.1 hypothetical protein N7448_002568 [Penicillium atrosanguineum]KAJ5300967.1 hypothetical protein N7443_005969 [Penicillium atrosanguineum]